MDVDRLAKALHGPAILAGREGFETDGTSVADWLPAAAVVAALSVSPAVLPPGCVRAASAAGESAGLVGPAAPAADELDGSRRLAASPLAARPLPPGRARTAPASTTTGCTTTGGGVTIWMTVTRLMAAG